MTLTYECLLKPELVSNSIVRGPNMKYLERGFQMLNIHKKFKPVITGPINIESYDYILMVLHEACGLGAR